MKRSNHTLTIALCLSLMAHGLGLSALAWWVVMTTPPPKLAAIDRDKLIIEQLTQELALPPKPPKPDKKSPPPPPQRPEKFEKPDDTMKDDSGEHNGVGTANRSSHGDKPMQAHQGLEQAELMKKDAKKFDDDSGLIASAGKKDDSPSNPQKNSKAGQVTPDFKASANGKDDPSARTALAMATDKGPILLPKLDQTKASNPTPSGEKNPPAKKPTDKPPTAASDLKEIRGHKAEISDTESVAFTRIPATFYRAGKVEGRKGLKVQTREPRYGYASEVDMESLGYPRTVLGVKVDADGNVLSVQILQSSGSPNIDRDRITAIWDWILEPEKDKDGNITSPLWTISLE